MLTANRTQRGSKRNQEGMQGSHDPRSQLLVLEGTFLVLVLVYLERVKQI
jgi:hypothetical protein